MISDKLKTAILIGCAAVLIISLVLSGYFYWLTKNRGNLQASQAQGLAFGKTTDDQGCWREALRRQHESNSFALNLQNNSFLLACLAAAPNSPGFCDGVPLPGQMVSAITWMRERCKNADSPASDCQALLRTVQTYCSEYHQSRPAQ